MLWSKRVPNSFPINSLEHVTLREPLMSPSEVYPSFVRQYIIDVWRGVQIWNKWNSKRLRPPLLVYLHFENYRLANHIFTSRMTTPDDRTARFTPLFSKENGMRMCERKCFTILMGFETQTSALQVKLVND